MPAKRSRSTQRLATIRKALAGDDTFEALSSIRELIVEKGKQQQVVVWVYACILETNSAGLSILFDRFTPREISRFERALREIGSTRTAADLPTLRESVEQAVDDGLSRLDASESVHESPLGRAIAKRTERQVGEMEAKLLAYCVAHLNELAAG